VLVLRVLAFSLGLKVVALALALEVQALALAISFWPGLHHCKNAVLPGLCLKPRSIDVGIANAIQTLLCAYLL